MDKSQQTDFKLKLTGELTEVDANTFIDMLGNLTLAIHEINSEIQSNKSLKITIKTIQPGSYDIFLAIKEFIIDPLTQHITKEDNNISDVIFSCVQIFRTDRLIISERL